MARNKDAEQAEMDVSEDSSEPRVYELAFHLDPELSETDARRSYDAVREAIAGKGKIIAEGEPEKVQLAYAISRTETAGRRDYDSAYFSWIAYEADGEGHEAALGVVKAEKRVIRFLDIRTTKDLAKHAAEMREMRARVPEKAEDENVSDTELDAALEEVTA